MNPRRSAFTAFAAALVAASLSCGGGGGGGVATTEGVSSGVVTGFGSFFSNGVEFFTNAGTVFNGGESSESELHLGMVVRVEASFHGSGSTADATVVDFDEILEGSVTAAFAGGQIEVLGQTVIIGDDTVLELEGRLLGDLVVGNILEVFGIRDALGNIQATRIEFEAEAFRPETEIEGTISDVTATTFKIGGLTVDYSMAVLENIPPGGLVDGLFVEVESSRDLEFVMMEGATEPQPVLLADEVEVEEPEVPAPGLRFEIEGFVTAVTAVNDIGQVVEFEVDGQPVRVSASTEFENGTRDDIQLNAKLEAEGVVGDDGVLDADEISFRIANTVEIEATVDSVDLDANSVTILGIEVFLTPLTQRIEDKTDAVEESFSLADIMVGDRLEIRGFINGEGRVIANRIEREDPEDEDENTLQGPVTVEGENLLSILGVGVMITLATEFENEADVVITRDEFFNALVSGTTIVKAEGPLSADAVIMIMAEEVELED